MNSIAYVKQSLEQSTNWFRLFANDMKNAPTARPTPGGGNHPLWITGHVIHTEAYLVATMIRGAKNPVEAWSSLFGQGTTPDPDPSRYPSFDELMATLEKVRAETLAYLDTITEDDLDKPSHAPQEYARMFGTIGLCLSMLTHHYVFHTGQIADARRAAGRPPLFG